jgi:hypothetical protein
MAIFILKDAVVSIAGTDLSSYVQSVTLDYAVDPIGVDAMGNAGHAFTAGLQNNSVAVTFNQDFAVSPDKVAKVLDGQIGLGTTTIIIKASSATTGKRISRRPCPNERHFSRWHLSENDFIEP